MELLPIIVGVELIFILYRTQITQYEASPSLIIELATSLRESFTILTKYSFLSKEKGLAFMGLPKLVSRALGRGEGERKLFSFSFVLFMLFVFLTALMAVCLIVYQSWFAWSANADCLPAASPPWKRREPFSLLRK